MTKVGSLAIIAALVLCACQGNRWYGSFVGKVSENSSVRHAAGPSADAAHGSSPQTDGDEVSLEREGKVAFLTFRKCRLRMELVDATHARVSEGQTCALVVSGYNTRMSMKGTATFEEGDMFSAELTGKPTEPGVTGEYVWRFQGSRKP
jgi:hypothetical protein